MLYSKIIARHFTVLLVGILTLSNCIKAQQAEKIDTILSKVSETDNFSGSILLARNGKLVYYKTVGYADRENRKPFTFNTTSSIASVGKMFTAVMVLKLIEEGKLNLKETITGYLPNSKVPNANVITIEHLLKHTSGLGNYMNHPRYAEVVNVASSLQPLVSLVEDMPVTHSTPGSNYEYSNSGYIILGKIIEEVSGHTYPEAIKRWIAKPGGIQKLNFKVNRKEFESNAKGYVKQKQSQSWSSTEAFSPFPASDGGVFTTAMELFKFDQALYSNKLIAGSSIQMMKGNLVEATLPGLGKMRYGYGIMLFDYSTGAYSVGHNGGFPGYACEYKHYFLPDKTEYTLIILANYDRVVRPILFEIQDLILKQKL